MRDNRKIIKMGLNLKDSIKILMVLFLLLNSSIQVSSGGALLMPNAESMGILESNEIAVIELNEDNTAEVVMFIALRDTSNIARNITFFIPLQERVIDETFSVSETNLEEFTRDEKISKLDDEFISGYYENSPGSHEIKIPLPPINLPFPHELGFGSTTVEVREIDSNKKVDELISNAGLSTEVKEQYLDYGSMYAYAIKMETKSEAIDIENEVLKLKEYCPKTYKTFSDVINNSGSNPITRSSGNYFMYAGNFKSGCEYEYYSDNKKSIESSIRDNIKTFDKQCPNAATNYIENFDLMLYTFEEEKIKETEKEEEKEEAEKEEIEVIMESGERIAMPPPPPPPFMGFKPDSLTPPFESLDCGKFRETCTEECEGSDNNPFICGMISDSIRGKICDAPDSLTKRKEIDAVVDELFNKLYDPQPENINGIKISYKLNLTKTDRKNELKFLYPLGTGKYWKDDIESIKIYAIIPEKIEVKEVSPETEKKETATGDLIYRWEYPEQKPYNDIEILIKTDSPVNENETTGIKSTPQQQPKQPEDNTNYLVIIGLLITLIILMFIIIVKKK